MLIREEPPAPLLWALIDEGVLHRPVAPAEVMREQLARLVEVSRRPLAVVRALHLKLPPDVIPGDPPAVLLQALTCA